jgi:hypothetical protein
MATVATYASHVGKAINFFFNTTNLMFAIGRSTPWGELPGETSDDSLIDDQHPPYPSLDAIELDEIIGYKRYLNKYFVIPDEASPDPIVDGVHWRKIALDVPPSDEEAARLALIEKVKTYKARWIYLDFQLDPNDFVGFTYRQIGLYSDLIVLPPATQSMRIYDPSNIQTGSGILEVVQNRAPVTRQIDQRELVAVVLEF